MYIYMIYNTYTHIYIYIRYIHGIMQAVCFFEHHGHCISFHSILFVCNTPLTQVDPSGVSKKIPQYIPSEYTKNASFRNAADHYFGGAWLFYLFGEDMNILEIIPFFFSAMVSCRYWHMCETVGMRKRSVFKIGGCVHSLIVLGFVGRCFHTFLSLKHFPTRIVTRVNV